MNNNANEPTREAAAEQPVEIPEAPAAVTPAEATEHPHDLISRGVTVIDKGRRGARHTVTVKGRTVIDHRTEE